MTTESEQPTQREQAAEQLLALLRQVRAETRPDDEPERRLDLDSPLESAWGLDSLSRSHLLTQIESAFSVHLPESALFTAQSPRELLEAVLQAGPALPERAHSQGAEVALPEDAPEPIPAAAQTLNEVLRWHAEQHPERIHLYLLEEDERTSTLRYGELWQAARRVAADLQQRGLQEAETVALMLPTGRAYFEHFFGVLLAGAVPVPIYPPARPSLIEDHLRRHAGILNNAAVTMLITVAEAKGVSRLLKWQVPSLRQVITVSSSPAEGPAYREPALGAEDTALLQYTSGSTGNPKGVILSHANLLANIRAMGQVIGIRPEDRFVSWLPLYHDMGLIGAWLGSLYFAVPLVLMSPLQFLARPQRWLWTIHRFRGTLSAAPNFAFDLCLRKLEERELEGLDLSCWRAAFNGAEPVSPQTLREFCDRFSRYGFRQEAMTPVYGLAECAVGLAFSPLGRPARIDRVEREALVGRGIARPAAEDDPQALALVTAGQPLPRHQLRVVDDTGRELPERHEGRLEFTGPSATRGYYRNSPATRQLLHGEWRDTGDLGYLAGGDLYLTGRRKDIIIRAGRNIYPQELEQVIGEVAGVRKGCVAVFAAPASGSGTEQLVVVAETRQTRKETLERIKGEISTLASDLVGLPPEQVVLAPPRSIPKTSSGKIRRFAAQELYQRHRLGQPPRAVWWQLLRLTWSGIARLVAGRWRQLGAWGYALYGGLLFSLIAPWCWLAVVLSPSLAMAQRVVRRASRLLLRLSATPVKLTGSDHLTGIGACMLVANHASYLDTLVLCATLPRTPRFVAKAELKRHWVVRRFLEQLETEFVERFDLRRGASDAGRLATEVRDGATLLVFPEGTLGRMPGLRRFHLGAFMAAAKAEVPVVPVALRGTRSKLRSGGWFLRRGEVSVTIGPPIRPPGSDWSAAIRLRDAARAALLSGCDEPDLG